MARGTQKPFRTVKVTLANGNLNTQWRILAPTSVREGSRKSQLFNWPSAIGQEEIFLDLSNTILNHSMTSEYTPGGINL